MYKNIFICLALAIAIDGCRGGIRVKRIAETSKVEEKKAAETAPTILTESSVKAATDESVGASLKGHGLNKKRGTLEHDASVLAHLAEDLKRHARTSFSRDLTKEHHPSRSEENDEVKLNKEKENLGTDVDAKASGGSLKDEKVGVDSHHHEEHGDRLERSTGGGQMRFSTGDNNDVQIRHDRKANKRDGRNLAGLTISTGGDAHHAVHDVNEGDTIKKLIEDVKLEGHKKELKPDVDVYLYGNMPAMYKSPPVLFEMFNTKEALMPTSFEHYYPPYKWLQRRSPMQSALEIANMMVKVGLDEIENEDYGEHVPFILDGNLANKGAGHKLERSFGTEAGFCPVHAKKVTFTGDMADLAESSSRYGECVCSFGRNSKEATSKLEELTRVKRDHSEEHPELKPMSFLKPF